MSVPLGRFYSTPDSHFYTRLRDIENNYYLEVTAGNVTALADSQAAMLDELARHASIDAELLDSFAEFRNSVQESLASIADSIDDLRTSLDRQTHVLSVHLQRIADTTAQQYAELLSIAQTLRNPLAAEVRELRAEADKWLSAGLAAEGEERNAHLEDAENLLLAVIRNPMGNQDYVAWFQIGYLRWKLRGDADGSEQAFARAVRLSTVARDAWHVKALRHLAYIRSLSDNHDGAVAAIRLALNVDPSANTTFDAARYEARAGDHNRSIELLGAALSLEPTLTTCALTDPDFTDIRPSVARLIEERRQVLLAEVRPLLGGVEAIAAELRLWQRDEVIGSLLTRLTRATSGIQAGSLLDAIEARAAVAKVLESGPDALHQAAIKGAINWQRRRESLSGAYQDLKARARSLSPDTAVHVAELHPEYESLMRHGHPASFEELADLVSRADKLTTMIGQLREGSFSSPPRRRASKRPDSAKSSVVAYLRRLFQI